MKLHFKKIISETSDNFFEGEVDSRYFSLDFKKANGIEENSLLPIEGHFDVEFDGDTPKIFISDAFFLSEDTQIRLSNLELSFAAVERYLDRNVNVDLSDYMVDIAEAYRYGRI